MKLEGEDLFVLFRVCKFVSKNVSKVNLYYVLCVGKLFYVVVTLMRELQILQ